MTPTLDAPTDCERGSAAAGYGHRILGPWWAWWLRADEHGNGEAVTLHQVDLCFPEEKLGELTRWAASEAGETALAAWGWSLERDPEGIRHWRPKGRGVSVDSERGFRFRGRREALTVDLPAGSIVSM